MVSLVDPGMSDAHPASRTGSQPTPLGTRRLFVLLAVFWSNASGYAFFAYFPYWLDLGGFSAAHVAFISVFQPLGVAAFSSVFGRASDRTGNRKAFVVGGLCLQLGTYVLLMLPQPLWLYCLWMGQLGTSYALRVPALTAHYADLAEARANHASQDYRHDPVRTGHVRGTQLSPINVLTSTGWATGAALSGLLIDGLGPGILPPFLVLTTGLGLASAVLLDRSAPALPVPSPNSLAGLVDEPACPAGQADESLPPPTSDAKPTEASRTLAHPEKQREPVKRVFFASLFLRHFGLIPILQILVLIIADAGIPPGFSGIIIALNPIGQIAAMHVMGRVIDKPRVSERHVIATGFALTAGTLTLYAIGARAGSPGAFVAAQLCLALAWGCIQTGSYAYVVNRAPEARAKYMGHRDAVLQSAKLSALQVYALVFLAVPYVAVLPFTVFFPLAAVACALFL